MYISWFVQYFFLTSKLHQELVFKMNENTWHVKQT
jgi:hypothetical protein